MPILKNLRTTTKIKLPKSGGTIEMYDEFLTGDYRQLMAKEKININDKNISIAKGFDMIVRLIADWDFTDENEKKLIISEESLDLLPVSDLNVLSEHISKVAEISTVDEGEKKN